MHSTPFILAGTHCSLNWLSSLSDPSTSEAVARPSSAPAASNDTVEETDDRRDETDDTPEEMQMRLRPRMRKGPTKMLRAIALFA